MVEVVPHQITSVVYDVDNSSNTQIVFSWDEVTGLQTGGSPIIEYQVDFDQGTSTWTTSSTSTSTITFDGLTGGMTYSVRVAAVNKYGPSELSDTLSVIAAQEPDTPDAPTTETVGLYVKIEWSEPEDNNAAIT